MVEMFNIHINNVLSATLNSSSGQYCGSVLSAQVDLAARPITQSSRTLRKEQEDGQQKEQMDRRAARMTTNYSDDEERKLSLPRSKTWLR